MDQENQLFNKPSTSWRSSRDLVCTALAVALGVVVGWIDMHVTEVIVTILALVAFGLILGLVQPAAAWRWALLIAVGLPIMELVAIKFNLQTAEPVHLELRITIVALGFSLLGAYIGVFIRYLMHTSQIT
jgi:MFS family permease